MRLPRRLTFNRVVRLDDPYTGASIMSSKCTEPLKETGKKPNLVKQKIVHVCDSSAYVSGALAGFRGSSILGNLSSKTEANHVSTLSSTSITNRRRLKAFPPMLFTTHSPVDHDDFLHNLYFSPTLDTQYLWFDSLKKPVEKSEKVNEKEEEKWKMKAKKFTRNFLPLS